MYPAPQVPEVPAVQVPDGAVLLDVREDDEWAAGHADGAVHTPLGDVPVRFRDLPPVDEAHPLYVICRSGARSARAVEWLAEQGVPSVNVGGGTLAWMHAGRAMSSTTGLPPTVA